MIYWIMGYQVLKFSGCGVGMTYNFVHPQAERSRSVEVERHRA
jgi:hypothetical protein